jgi:hypothetical protein
MYLDNIVLDLREITLGGMDWIDVAKDRDHQKTFVNRVMYLRVSNSAQRS